MLCGVERQAYLTDVLTKLVNLWPSSRLDELMPGAWAKEARQEPHRLTPGSRPLRSVPAQAKAAGKPYKFADGGGLYRVASCRRDAGLTCYKAGLAVARVHRVATRGVDHDALDRATKSESGEDDLAVPATRMKLRRYQKGS